MSKFQPGQSGNPGGRPKTLGALTVLARQHTELAITVLVAILRDKKAGLGFKVAAAKEINDRGWGRAPQAIDVRMLMEKRLTELSDQELMELENKVLALEVGEHEEIEG